MATFEQTFLKPGRYGSAGEWTKDRIAAHVQGTKQLIAAGYCPPILFEHAEPGSAEGSPVQFSERDRKADIVKHGAGWLVDVKQAADGSGVYVLDVTDEKAIGKLRDKSIQFTSPEFRNKQKLGTGEIVENVIAHVALTHKPRAINQGPIQPVDGVEALQFSLADFEGPIQFADDGFPPKKSGDDNAGGDDAGDKPEGSKPAEAAPENPDMPKDNSPDKLRQKREAVVAHMDTLGLGLPADTMDCDEEQFLDRVLTGLLTLQSSKAKAEEEAAAKEKANSIEDDEQITEQQPPMQFSLADAEAGTIGNKLLSRVIKQEHTALAGRLEGMVKAGQITPACRDRLLSCNGATQFSADGEHLAAYTLPQVVEILEKTTLPGMGIQPDVLQFAAVEHPKGDKFISGDGTEKQFSSDKPQGETPEEAEAVADEIWGKKKAG